MQSFAIVSGTSKVTAQTQPAGAGCGPSSSSITYDAQANVTSRTDFTNRKTCYGNDLSRNLETSRVEGLTSVTACPADVAAHVPAVGTEQRKILTQWHPDWRLETRRAEPKRIVTSVYNGQPDPTAGNAITTCAPSDALVDGKPIAVVCKQVEQATSDETGGAGFGATAVGTPRIQRWTYNKYGRVLTANGPRTDNPGGRDDLTTYEYYADTQADWTLGDLKQVTNALGQITRFTRYDRNGRLLQQLDPNGARTDYAYTPRGWLTQVKVTPSGGAASQSTVYEYDPVGQLTRATLPDGTSTTYTYDAARRLTDVADSAGNRVSYTLDAMGNRTREEWKDPGGTLRKTLTRSIDALNRVQQVVGGVQ
jgi:YD repeat-containing protein